MMTTLTKLFAATMVLSATSAMADREGIAKLFESSFASEATNKNDRALKDVQAILAEDGSNYVAVLRAGWLSYLLGHYGEAITYYDKASALAPKALEPRLGAMLPLMAQQKWAAAEKLATAILKLAPRNYLAASRLAYIHFSMGRYAEAEADYKAVLEEYPSDLDMMLGLGWSHIRRGNKPAAKELFERVLLIRRQNASALAGLKAL